MLEDGQQHRVLAQRVDGRVDQDEAGQLLAAVRGEAQAQRRRPWTDPTATTASFSAASLSKAPSTVATQSAQVTLFMSCQRVPWPGSSGISTAYPRAARSSAQGRIEAGLPVKPCTTSTPISRPPVSSGFAAASTSGRRGRGRGVRPARRGRESSRAQCAPAGSCEALERRVAGWSRYERRSAETTPGYRDRRDISWGRQPHRAGVARDRGELRRARCPGRPVGPVGRGGPAPRTLHRRPRDARACRRPAGAPT